MEMDNVSDNEGKVVFTRLSADTANWLEDLREQLGLRGVSTVIRRILENVQKEGVTVRKEKPSRKAKQQAA